MRNFVYTSTAKFILFLRSLKLFIRDEKKSTAALPLSLKLKFYSRGFFSQNITNYNLVSNNYKNYVSDWYRLFRIFKINLCHSDLINDKFLFHDFFKENPRVVRPIALIKNKELLDFESKDKISVDSLRALDIDLIFKPRTGGRGKGIEVVRRSDDTNQSIEKLLHSGNNYVIQKLIVQDGLPHKINPNSLNTLRILTMTDATTKEPFIAKTVQRFGTLQSDFVDNFSAGGIAVDTDIESGIYKKGAIRNNQNQIDYLSQHPDTAVVFEGKQIKDWPEIKKTVLEMSQELHQLKYLGWDVIPLNGGFKILEVNRNSDVNLFQLFGGLLRDDRIKKFYRDNHKINNPKCVLEKIKARFNS